MKSKLKPKTRQEKIDFINGLRNGTRSVKEFLPVIVSFWHYTDGYYINESTGDRLSIEQFKNRTLTPGNIHRTVVFKNYS